MGVTVTTNLELKMGQKVPKTIKKFPKLSIKVPKSSQDLSQRSYVNNCYSLKNSSSKT